MLPATPGAVVRPTAGQCGHGVSPLPASDWLLRCGPRLLLPAARREPMGGCAARWEDGGRRQQRGPGRSVPAPHAAGSVRVARQVPRGVAAARREGAGAGGGGRSRLREGLGAAGAALESRGSREGEREVLARACCVAGASRYCSRTESCGISVCAQCTVSRSGILEAGARKEALRLEKTFKIMKSNRFCFQPLVRSCRER